MSDTGDNIFGDGIHVSILILIFGTVFTLALYSILNKTKPLFKMKKKISSENQQTFLNLNIQLYLN